MYSMEQEQKPTPIVHDWMQLACDAHYSKNLFHDLPEDIQGHIFAQIHPRQTIDEWLSNDAVCIEQITVPDKIDCFDIYNDLFLYACQNSSTKTTEIYYVDLATGNNSPFGDVWEFGLPISDISIGNRGKYALLKTLYNNLITTSLHNLLRYGQNHNSLLNNKIFSCHTQLPFAATINKKGDLYIHALGQEYTAYKGPGFIGEPIFLTWHPTQPILAVAHKKRIAVHNMENNSSMKNDMKSNFESLHFTFDGSLSWTLKRNKHMYTAAYMSDILCSSYKKVPITYNIKKFTAKMIGDSVLLLQNKQQDNNKKTSYVLQSIKAHKQLPAFDTTHKYKLPRNHDYRYVTVDLSTDNKKSTVSIFVPRSKVLLPHYCIMKAALEAKKTDNQANWNLFNKPEYTTLVHETAKYYSYFARLKQKFIDNSTKKTTLI